MPAQKRFSQPILKAKAKRLIDEIDHKYCADLIPLVVHRLESLNMVGDEMRRISA